MIFLRVLPPSFLLDSSLYAGPDSPWCEALRMKKSIVQVCNSWCQIGSELLYEEISIRRVGQISALLRTLDANNGIGDMIKTFEISCFTPTCYKSLFQVDIARILHSVLASLGSASQPPNLHWLPKFRYFVSYFPRPYMMHAPSLPIWCATVPWILCISSQHWKYILICDHCGYIYRAWMDKMESAP